MNFKFLILKYIIMKMSAKKNYLIDKKQIICPSPESIGSTE